MNVIHRVLSVLFVLGICLVGVSYSAIVIGVALETFRDLEAQLTMRHYKGFLG